MRSIEESRKRWQLTARHARSLEALQKAVRSDYDRNPCISGLRSVCWKTFLLFETTEVTGWSHALVNSRGAYTSLREHILRFIENPDELGSSIDPLDDDRDSPWNTLRQDEEIRAEILQDVERCMPDEPFFRKPETQRMMLDILFIFCKINQDIMYRQGMHEMLAPLLWVVEQDAICYGTGVQESSAEADVLMEQVLDKSYIEHDAFTLLSLVMRSAKSFYELAEPGKHSNSSSTVSGNLKEEVSPIVERSKRIHEVYLTALDPDLAKHLTDIEVLPQIFLIRWTRLLFGREFPYDDLLALWDTIFAEDPALDLVDMICVAMLLRIRWQLIESNYSFALMLLLRYPSPQAPNGPQSFVDDAIFLRANLNEAGGAQIIKKYSGKAPPIPSVNSRPPTPLGQTISPTRNLYRTKSPLASPARFLQQQGGVEALFQGAAKGVFDQGERLGINQAVRNAVGEVKKNMHDLQASRSNSYKERSSEGTKWSLDEGKAVPSGRAVIAKMNARNRQLARMLEQAMSDLRKVSVSPDQDKDKYIAAMDLAIAKVDFVQVYLEDATIPLADDSPEDELTSGAMLVAIPQVQVENFPEVRDPSPQSTSAIVSTESVSQIHTSTPSNRLKQTGPAVDVSATKEISTRQQIGKETLQNLNPSIHTIQSSASRGESPARPSAPVPTRSTIAQSSFSWMLEPDTPNSSSSPPKSSSPFLKSSRKPTSGPNREKAAFLFGEDGGDATPPSVRPPPLGDAAEGFNMRNMRGSSTK